MIKDLDKYRPADLFFGGVIIGFTPAALIYFFIKWSASLG